MTAPHEHMTVEQVGTLLDASIEAAVSYRKVDVIDLLRPLFEGCPSDGFAYTAGLCWHIARVLRIPTPLPPGSVDIVVGHVDRATGHVDVAAGVAPEAVFPQSVVWFQRFLAAYLHGDRPGMWGVWRDAVVDGSAPGVVGVGLAQAAKLTRQSRLAAAAEQN